MRDVHWVNEHPCKGDEKSMNLLVLLVRAVCGGERETCNFLLLLSVVMGDQKTPEETILTVSIRHGVTIPKPGIQTARGSGWCRLAWSWVFLWVLVLPPRC